MKTQYTVTLAMLAGFGLGAVAIQGLHAQAKPPAYVITEVQIIDEAAFKEFAPKVDATMAPFGGKRLIRGGQVVALEGEAPKRVIVTVYESMEKAQAQRNSAAYKELLPLRAKAVKVREYIAEGIAN
jgi:uncharacterized protein (DUF1330 family)